jgi:hypothetical protein
VVAQILPEDGFERGFDKDREVPIPGVCDGVADRKILNSGAKGLSLLEVEVEFGPVLYARRVTLCRKIPRGGEE